MSTKFENTSEIVGDNAARIASDRLSLADFNRDHGAELRRAARSRDEHRLRQQANRVFDCVSVLLVLSTVAAFTACLFSFTVH